MTRTTWAVDRLVTVLVGLLLVGVGVLAVVWRYEWWSVLATRTDTSAAISATERAWWPWALLALGVVLCLAGLRWLFAHLPAPAGAPLNLRGTSKQGRLSFDAGRVAATAAEELAASAGVRSARGRIKRDRGQLLVDIRATTEVGTDLGQVAAAVDRVVGDVARVTGREDLYSRVHLSISKSESRSSRVQ